MDLKGGSGKFCLPKIDTAANHSRQLFRWLAVVMDNFLRFPGTKLRFGVDPIIGLFPGIGDAASAIISTLALVYAARYRLPKILLVRMALNILINELVGIIPVLGDAFSFWFKSNVRNYELVRRYAAAPERARKPTGYSSLQLLPCSSSLFASV